MSYPEEKLNFENSENAFKYKSNAELKQALILFNSMRYPLLVKMGTKLTPWAIKSGLPVRGLIRKTIFKQFVGGETLEETTRVTDMLDKYNVQVILDYGAEGGLNGEEGFEEARKQFLKVIDFAGTQDNVPFMSIKVTGIARFELMEKMDTLMHQANSTLMGNYEKVLGQLSEEERKEWEKVIDRMVEICEHARKADVGVLIDAEDSYIQDPIDAMVCKLMDTYNRDGKCLVYNTAQLYRHDRLAFMKSMLEAAKSRGFILGMKLVRGAYMEKERARAEEKGYQDPIQPDKESTDRDFDESARLCMDNLDSVSMVLASHNEDSNQIAVEYLQQKGILLNHPHVHFSQLYGMSDNITFNLAKLGCNVSKYLPFGPIEEVVPYLMRRAEENSSIDGQTSRELVMIRKELKRRGA